MNSTSSIIGDKDSQRRLTKTMNRKLRLTSLMLLLLVPAYGAFASRVNRIRLINGVTLFFASHLVVFHQLAAHGVRIFSGRSAGLDFVRVPVAPLRSAWTFQTVAA